MKGVPRPVLLGGIFLLALVLRIIYLAEYSQSVEWDLLSLDTQTHDMLARKIADTGSVGDHPFFRAPLYPYFLGAVYALFGPDLLLPRILNILFGALSCVLLFLIGERLFKPGVALGAALTAAVYWIFIFFEGELLLVSLYVFLLLLSFYLLLVSEGKAGVKLALAGLILGLAAITRPNVLLFFPFYLLWLGAACENWKREIVKRALYFFIPALIVIFGVTARNYLVGKDRVLIAYQGGINFYLGNNPESDGHSATPVCDVRAIPPFYLGKHGSNLWIKDDVWLSGYYVAETRTGRDLEPSEMQDYWYDRTFDFILGRPAEAGLLFLKKTYYLLNAYEIPSNKNLYQSVRESSHLLRFLSFLDFGVILSFGLLGMLVSLARVHRLFLFHCFILVYGFTNVAFFINTRYRVPLIPFLLLFAFYFLFWLAEKFRARDFVRPGLALLLCGGLLFFTHTAYLGIKSPRLESVLHHNQGTALMEQGKLERAAAAFQESIRLYPDAAVPYENLCWCLDGLGRYDEVIRRAEEGLARFPENGALYFQLGTAHVNREAYEAGIKALEKAVLYRPEDLKARVNLGVACYQTRALARAEEQFKGILDSKPTQPMILLVSHIHLGFIALERGDADQAILSFKAVLATDPNHLDGLIHLARAQARKGDDRAARETLGKALKVDPGNEEALDLERSLNP